MGLAEKEFAGGERHQSQEKRDRETTAGGFDRLCAMSKVAQLQAARFAVLQRRGLVGHPHIVT